MQKIIFFVFFSIMLFSCAGGGSADKRRQDADVVLELAGIYHETQAFGEEENVLKELISEQGNKADSRVVYNLAVLYYEQKKYDEVIELCSPYVDRYFAHLRFRRIIAKSFAAQGKTDEACELYEKLVLMPAVNEEDILALSEIYEQRGDIDRKKEIIERALNSGMLTPGILKEAVKVSPDNEEYAILLRNIK